MEHKAIVKLCWYENLGEALKEARTTGKKITEISGNYYREETMELLLDQDCFFEIKEFLQQHLNYVLYKAVIIESLPDLYNKLILSTSANLKDIDFIVNNIQLVEEV